MCINTMPRRKDISCDLREAIVGGYKAISKLSGVHPTVRKTVHEWKTFKTASNLSRSGHTNKFTPRSDCAMLRHIAKKY